MEIQPRHEPLGQKLLAAHPHDFDFLYLNGIIENVEGKYEIARGHLQEAVGLNPDITMGGTIWE